MIIQFKNLGDRIKIMKNSKVSIIKKIRKISDVVVSEETALELINENYNLNSCYVLIQEIDSIFINKCLNKGVKKFVFTSIDIYNKSNLKTKVVALLFNKELSSEVDTQIFKFSEFIIFIDDKELDVKHKSIIELARNKDLPFFLLISQFNHEELEFVKNFNLKPIINTATELEMDKSEDWFLKLIDFKNKGLIPTIVKDRSDTILMQAFSNQESLKKTLNTNLGTFYSRSRNKIWVKGESSGNYQRIINIRFDCDFDSLVFTVEQEGSACHLNSYSCFNFEKFDSHALYSILSERISKKDKKSYSYRISQDEKKLMEKIYEESLEVINYTDENNLIWEISDLFYFLYVLMVKKGISLDSIFNELRRRNMLNVARQ
jgi:phosphoribosyl-ATP pyrophosphohydrolase/phosphoribosyl-AMP cyclohydrolase